MTAAFEMTLETLSLNRPYYLSEVWSQRPVFLSLPAQDASTKPNVHRIAVQLRSKDVGLILNRFCSVSWWTFAGLVNREIVDSYAAKSLPEEPYALIGLVRVCGGASSTRKCRSDMEASGRKEKNGTITSEC